MKKSIVIFVLTQLLVIGCSKNNELTKLRGTWINEEYAKNLSNEKQPMKAEKTDLYNIQIGKEWVVMDYDLHVGLGNYKVVKCEKAQKSNTYRLQIEHDTTKHYITINSIRDTIKMTWEGHFYNYKGRDSWGIKHFYLLKRPFQNECDNLVIGGTYIDHKGLQYTFSDTGYAKWPTKIFKYEVCLDYLGIKKDCIINYSEKTIDGYVTYGFSIKGDTLSLYKEKESNEMSVVGSVTDFEKNPFLILRKKHD
jgi:hypothetical protein